MTKEELILRLKDIEWDDFEVKEALNKLPENVWETVSAFSNTSGGWIVFGIKQNGKQFEIQGVENGEKIESDFLNTLRGGQKFNTRLFAEGKKYTIDGHLVLAFYVPSSSLKPIYVNNPINTFIRSESGDRRASEGEIAAMQRDQAFGFKSEQLVVGTTLKDLDSVSLETFRNQIRNFNPEFPYNKLPNDEFCEKVGIVKEGVLTYGGLLMLGKRDSVQKHVSNFWIDHIEVPGTNFRDAGVRYTYRMPEQANRWESYQIILQRLRIYCDAPYVAQSDGHGIQDETQLYALREGLTNLCAHCDYFSPMHPVIRVFTDRIEMQNPGKFMFPLSELRKQIHSMPRNPILSKLFRFARLGENAGYGIDKMLMWEQKRGKVEFADDIVSSTITFYFEKKDVRFSVTGLQDYTQGGTPGGDAQNSVEKTPQKTTEKTENHTVNHTENHTENHAGLSRLQREIIIKLKSNPKYSRRELVNVIENASLGGVISALTKLQELGLLRRVGPDKGGHWEIIE